MIFFALIRYTYNQRAVESEWRRLTFALFWGGQAI